MAHTITSVTKADITAGLERLGLDNVEIAVVHSSLSAFGWVEGGPKTVVAALRAVVPTVLVPAFSYASRLPTPPGFNIPFNADEQATSWDEFRETLNRTPVHGPHAPLEANMGAVAGAVAVEPDAVRSPAPICTFAGVGPRAQELLAQGTTEDALCVLAEAADRGGWVVLLGVAHNRNTTIHVAENLEHRGGHTRFARVAADPRGWKGVHRVGGESEGFPAIEPHLDGIQRETIIGAARCRAAPAADLIRVARELIRRDPTALVDPNDLKPGNRPSEAIAKRRAHLRRMSSTANARAGGA